MRGCPAQPWQENIDSCRFQIGRGRTGDWGRGNREIRMQHRHIEKLREFDAVKERGRKQSHYTGVRKGNRKKD